MYICRSAKLIPRLAGMRYFAECFEITISDMHKAPASICLLYLAGDLQPML